MKIFVGHCNSQEYVPAAFHWSWVQMRHPYEEVVIRFDDHDDVCRCNNMIRTFLKSDCDIMVKMDIDQVYPQNYFSFMVPLVEKYKVIGPRLHNKWRKTGYRPLAFKTNDFPYLAPAMELPSEIVEVPYAHTNLFYAREVLEAIEPPWYEKHFNPHYTHRTDDMDFEFLDKVKAAGYPIYINPGVEVAHLVMEGVDSKLNARWNRL